MHSSYNNLKYIIITFSSDIKPTAVPPHHCQFSSRVSFAPILATLTPYSHTCSLSSSSFTFSDVSNSSDPFKYNNLPFGGVSTSKQALRTSPALFVVVRNVPLGLNHELTVANGGRTLEVTKRMKKLPRRAKSLAMAPGSTLSTAMLESFGSLPRRMASSYL